MVGIPGEVEASGRVAVIHGAAEGPAHSGGLLYSQGTLGVPGAPAPGRRFGAAVSLLDADGDGRDDAVVTAPDGTGSLFVLRGLEGRFAGPGATRDKFAWPAGAKRAPDHSAVVLGS